MGFSSLERRSLGVWLALAGLAAACGEPALTPESVTGPFAWGNTTSVMQIRHLYLAGQPDRAGLEAARAAGVEVVINLRDPSEHDWDEAGAARELGLTYHSVPVAKAGPFSRQSMERIEALVREHHPAPTLVHCSSGNRAAGWLAVHLSEEHDLELADALAVARAAGITKDAIVEKVEAYLSDAAPR